VANPRVFWDNGSGLSPILTVEDFTNQDWENLTGDELMNRLPIGLDTRSLVNMLVQQIAFLTKKQKQLESEVVDKILLEDKRGS